MLKSARRLTAECKCELEERNGSPSTRTEAVCHDVDVGVSPAEFGIDDNESDGPISNST